MKLLIVRSSDLSSWGSCKVISPNLQESYKLLANKLDLLWFNLPTDYIQQEIAGVDAHIIDLSLKIKNERPDKIVFTDHLPNSAEILNKLSLVMDLDQLPPVVIHVYGDFTYFSKDWVELSPKLINHPVKFLTASNSQKKLLSYFCEDSKVVEQLCFPVDSNAYFFDSKARLKIRNEMDIDDQDIVILYSGRISLQKNVDLLLREYLTLTQNPKRSIHLWLVGAFDDLGAPFMGAETDEGYLYAKMESMLHALPEEARIKIKFWGLQNKEKLREIKSAADLFISLSLYHDEDYGMSPAEALACGLPCLLTDWGGYSSFASDTWRCQLMPVSITEFGLQIKISSIKQFVNTYIDSKTNETDRKRWSDEFLNHFSIKNNSRKLGSFLQKPFSLFQGFTWSLAPFSEQFGKSSVSKTISSSNGPSNKNFYYQVYKNYISLDEPFDKHGTYEPIQWMYDHIKNSEAKHVQAKVKKSRSYHHYLKPFSHKYYSPHNATLLLDGRIPNKLIDKPICTLRDGMIPLCIFLAENLPNKFSGKVAINKNLWFLVPELWREKILFYEIKSDIEFDRLRLPKKIFITGLLNSSLADPEEFAQDLIALNNTLGKENIETMEVMAFLPNKKTNLWGNWKEDNLIKLSNSLFQNLKKDIHFPDWQSLQIEANFKDCLYFEMNRAYFIQDTFTKHFALSRGAGLLTSKTVDVPGELIKTHRLSLYHSVDIYQPDYVRMPDYVNPFNCEYFEYFKNMCETNKKSKISTSWESWFAYYLKRYYKLYPPTLL